MPTNNNRDNDEDKDNKPEWAKGVNKVNQMFIATAYREQHGLEIDEPVLHIDEDELKTYKKQAKKAAKHLY